MAHYVGIERSYLYRIFMEHENTSPKQYLLKHRLQMAAQLLCSSSCTITEAALSCGFRDAPSFCNYFRQGTGYTPKEFRKAYSGTIYI
ncbi:MAG: helix-turn-helix transcriptional regulator [Clostridium sp.]